MVPDPFKVTEPLINKYVLLPFPWRVMVPLLVMAPVSCNWALFCTLSVPLLVRPLRLTVLLARTLIAPEPDVVSVPPVQIVAPAVRLTAEPARAWMVPPVLVQVVPLNSSVPPPEASIVLVLVAAENDCSVSVWPLTLALIVPLLVNTPVSIVPAPVMVSSLTSPAPASTLAVYAGRPELVITRVPVPVGTVAVGAVEVRLVARGLQRDGAARLVIVPAASICALFCTFVVPLMVRPVRLTMLLAATKTCPVPTELRVPPVMLALRRLDRPRSLPDRDRSPPALFQTEPFNSSVPPP